MSRTRFQIPNANTIEISDSEPDIQQIPLPDREYNNTLTLPNVPFDQENRSEAPFTVANIESSSLS